ncbi:hypothetical protein [Candidatus Venteria ishoeyi]|uniref:hypothetical protein n=1 Tax=Candidatus Venteria ishoeyi TaxID=1899563 RepID=UPI00255CB822|nr:hypothetical protein [Candidatus Venteria ishoeyi]
MSIKVVSEGILISLKHKPREGWQESIATILASSDSETIDSEWLDASLIKDETLEW